MDSFNVSVAAAITLHHVMRDRMERQVGDVAHCNSAHSPFYGELVDWKCVMENIMKVRFHVVSIMYLCKFRRMECFFLWRSRSDAESDTVMSNCLVM